VQTQSKIKKLENFFLSQGLKDPLPIFQEGVYPCDDPVTHEAKKECLVLIPEIFSTHQDQSRGALEK
jgi:hypothetical protein